ncbi:MAG: HlyD family secretion protein [Phenylobacterium sp.]|nr:HlyD family secretion protein [Phenylobacterium sp.]
MMQLLRSRAAMLAAAGIATVAVVVLGAFWWIGKQRYESTDNAFIQADNVAVAPLVEGYVAEVLVDDNETVTAGQVVARIDPATIRARLAAAEANAAALEAAIAQVDDRGRLAQAVIAERAAAVTSARAQARFASSELDRYGKLASSGFVSSQRAQNARAAAEKADADVAQAAAALEAERRSASGLGSARAQSVAQAAAARAEVEQARIDLARTEIKAPAAGVVGARGVRPGQYVRPGAVMMTIVPLGEAFVVANFKETQVARLRIGQPVEIQADAFGRQPIKGRVTSFSPATGAEFALIPVENAVGNFTKIAQRLPVKIAVDPGQPLSGALRPGLSVEVKVDVRENTGASFAEAAQAPARFAGGAVRP